jgi:hypothetical protein
MATHLLSRQSSSFKHADPLVPVTQSPALVPSCKQRPPLQSLSLSHGA